MDQGSSPCLPAASLATNKSYGSSESMLIGNRINLSFDDSSSVTSMSSTSRLTRCMACKEEATIVKVLILCIRCKWKIHPGCANPYIEDYEAPWTCPRCKKDKKDQSQIAKKVIAEAFSASKGLKQSPAPYNSPYAPSHPAPNAPSESPKESKKMAGIRCEIAGCNAPIFYLPSNTRPLCTKHKAEQRNASAKNLAPKPAPTSRPFKKDKLYPVKPDDKQFLKRKRPIARSTSSASSHEYGQITPTSFTFQAPEARTESTFKAPETFRSPPMPAASSPRSDSKRTPEQTGMQFQFFPSTNKSLEEIEQSVDDLNRSLGSASMAESPIEPTPGWQANPLRPDSARVTPHLTAQCSPEYSPPPPQVDDEINPWAAVDDRDDSPGSQIAQELAATASQQDMSETTNSNGLGMAGLPSIEEEITAGRAHPYTPIQLRQQVSKEDEEMLDADALALIDRLESEHPTSPSKSASPAAQSPTSSTYSANVSSNEDSEQKSPSDADPAPVPEALHGQDPTPPPPPPNSIEAIRAERAANFDTSELDKYLFKQSQPKSDELPTTKELLATQIWGNIDPRVAWPRKMTPEEIKEKIKEIEARGGKKVNFGKLLTPQVRKERAEKGWNIHQTGEKRPQAECDEMARRMGELFGNEGLANCVPGLRDGKLVMIEQLEPEELQTGPGRRKRRREPKIYPIVGGL